MSEFTQGRALLIGVGEYQDQIWTVSATARDAQEVAAALKRQDIAAYHERNVKVMCNAETRLADVTVALRTLARQAKPTHTVPIFFSGHGALAPDGTFSLAVHDAVFTDGRTLTPVGFSPPMLRLIVGIESHPTDRSRRCASVAGPQTLRLRAFPTNPASLAVFGM